MTATTVPTETVWSSSTRISARKPAAGDGTSESTLSVETSSRGSSASTASPTDFSHVVTVPSVTDSPRAGMRTSVPEAGAEAMGDAGAGATGASATGAGAVGASATGAGAEVASDASPIIAIVVPTSTVSSSGTRISSSTPATGDGTSESTLSVETSTMGSSAAIVSPTFFSQVVTVPSVTDSPRAGIVTAVAMDVLLERRVC